MIFCFCFADGHKRSLFFPASCKCLAAFVTRCSKVPCEYHPNTIYLSSQSENFGSYKLYLCVYVCVCVPVPLLRLIYLAYCGSDLIKLGENVGTLVWLILSKFRCATISMRFSAFRVDWDTFFFENFLGPEAQIVRERSEQDASTNMLRQTVTLATAIFLLLKHLAATV